MAEIRPFSGVHYNQRLVKDLSPVICPPYDIITPQLQQELYHRSPYNFVRLEYNRELPEDTVGDNKYTRSVATLRRWLEQGILEVDGTPAIYLHDHHFTFGGRKYRRRGITACVRLEEWERMVVRPHEGVLARDRTDRISRLRELQANTSPILALFDDRGRQVASLLEAEEPAVKPLISLSGLNGEGHTVWAISEPRAVNRICQSLAGQPLYVADGHHRYESALAYRRERETYSPPASGDEAFNYVMMTLVDFADPGLVIRPLHRLVRGISRPTLNGLMAQLEALFEVEELSGRGPGVWSQVEALPAGKNEIRLLLFGPGGGLFVLRLRDLAAASHLMPYFHSELYKRLAVSVADHVILEKLLGMSGLQDEARVTYSDDRQDAVNRVLDQEYQLALLLEPVGMGVIKAIADAGDRLPRKSTSFYPKLPAGLVFYRLA